MNKFDIFISYSRKDVSASDKIYKILIDNGFAVWRDKELLLSGNFDEQIKSAINEVKVFIIIESPSYKLSELVTKEIKYAEQSGKYVLRILSDMNSELSGIQKLTYHTEMDMSDSCLETKLLYKLLMKGCKPNTYVLYEKGLTLYAEANSGTFSLKDSSKKEAEAFLCFLRATELGNNEARSYVEQKSWNINLRTLIREYQQINAFFITDLAESLYRRGETLGEDKTISDNTQRGRGMEKAAFCLMKRAIDLGYDGYDPTKSYWYYLAEKDFEECLNKLGNSSKMYSNMNSNMNPQRHKNSKTSISPITDSYKEESENSEQFKIFISYKRVDKDSVFAIKDMIEQKTGKRCWVDLDGIESDAQFANVICEAINNAQVFLFMYSHAHSEIKEYDTDWTVREIHFAEKKRKKIVFINIDGTPLTDWFELTFGVKQQIDASSKVQMDKLCKDLMKWLK